MKLLNYVVIFFAFSLSFHYCIKRKRVEDYVCFGFIYTTGNDGLENPIAILCNIDIFEVRLLFYFFTSTSIDSH